MARAWCCSGQRLRQPVLWWQRGSCCNGGAGTSGQGSAARDQLPRPLPCCGGGGGSRLPPMQRPTALICCERQCKQPPAMQGAGEQVGGRAAPASPTYMLVHGGRGGCAPGCAGAVQLAAHGTKECARLEWPFFAWKFCLGNYDVS
jgi:hypothetical protein